MNEQSAKVVSLLDCPDELLLRCFVDLGPRDLVSVASVSHRLRAVSLDPSIWRQICNDLISICQPLAEEGEGVELVAWGAKTHFDLWNRFLRRWEDYLGFWVPSKPTPYRELVRISASNKRGAIEAVKVHLSNNFQFDTSGTQDGTPQGALPGSLVANGWGVGPGILIALPLDIDNNTFELFMDENTLELFIDRLSPAFVIRSMLSFRLPPVGSPAAASAPHLIYSPQRPFRWHSLRRLPMASSRSPPFPSPSLVPAFRGAKVDSLGDLQLPTLAPKVKGWEWESSLLPIHSPTSKHWISSNDIIDNGLYAASYPVHGVEVFLVTVRTLTSKDFEHASSYSLWPWEGTLAHDDPILHLGPFVRGTTPNLCIPPGSVQPGQRIFEVVKIHGDHNVPRGVRSIIGFLDPGTRWSVSADMRAAEMEMRMNHSDPRTSRLGLPPVSHRSPFKPWPMRANETGQINGSVRALTTEEAMSPGEGWTFHGVGRIAREGFRDPTWTSCLIHLESRQEFLVGWLGSVTTFKRLSNF